MLASQTRGPVHYHDFGRQLSSSVMGSGVDSTGRRQNLQRDVAIELRIAGAVHLAHSAGAERRHDFIRAETRAGGERQTGRILARAGSKARISNDQPPSIFLGLAPLVED